MPYLTNVSQEQTSRGQSSGTVRVSWTFGNMIPDAIEIRQPGDTVTPPTLLASIRIDATTKTPTSHDLVVVSPSFLSLVVSPRTVQNGILTDRMVDDSGQLQYWETFSVSMPLLPVVANPSGGSGSNKTSKPRLGNVDIREGAFTVHWASGSVDHFNVTLVPSVVPFQGQLELAGSDRAWTQDRVIGGRSYRFSIQGCKKGILDVRSNCSEWVYTDISVPLELGFQSWRRWFPLPGRHVFDRDKQQIAAVSRAPGNLDLFVIGFDNHVYTTFWNDAGGWNGDWFPLPGQHLFDRDKQQIAAVSRVPGHLDLFVIGFDNVVWTTWWEA